MPNYANDFECELRTLICLNRVIINMIIHLDCMPDKAWSIHYDFIGFLGFLPDLKASIAISQTIEKKHLKRKRACNRIEQNSFRIIYITYAYIEEPHPFEATAV